MSWMMSRVHTGWVRDTPSPGSDCGYGWYLDGKLAKKTNAFASTGRRSG